MNGEDPKESPRYEAESTAEAVAARLAESPMKRDLRERARLFEYISWIGVFLSTGTFVTLLFSRLFFNGRSYEGFKEAAAIAVFSIIILVLLRMKMFFTSIIVTVVGSLGITSYLIFMWEGIYAPFPVYFIIVILLVGTFLSVRLTTLVAVICIIVYSAIILGQFSGYLPAPSKYHINDFIVISLLAWNASFVAAALLSQMFSRLLTTHGRAMEASERRYRELVESAPDMIISFDYTGRIIDVNKRVTEVLGYSRAELLEMTGRDLVWPEDSNTVAAYFISLMKTGFPRMIEIDMMDREGRRIPVEVNHTITMESGKPVGMRAIARDITERRRMQTEQDKLRERLILSEKLAGLGHLVLGISHEYNNILAGLRGLAEVSRLPNHDKLLKDLPDSIIQLVDRAQQVTKGLLGFAQRFEPVYSQISLLELVLDVLRLTGKELEMKKIKVETDVPSGLSIYTEVGKLQEVLLNLIINARDAMNDGGTLRLTAVDDRKIIRISVSDTGGGIPPENLKRIFDPFFTTKGPIGGGDQKGTGLGLSLSYGIIQSLGGDIIVDSEKGVGSTFTIIFPHRTPETYDESIVPTESRGDTTVARKTRNVLVVEDEAVLCDTLVEFLQAAGHKTEGVADGEEGLVKLDEKDYDIALIDLLMPGIPGEEFIVKANMKQPKLAFIVITGRDFTSELDHSRISALPNVVAILRKPFPFEKAVSLIDEHFA